MANEEVARILHLNAAFLPAILGTGCRFYRTPDGAIEQRSAEGLVCRWEHAPDGAVHQVVYDRALARGHPAADRLDHPAPGRGRLTGYRFRSYGALHVPWP